MDRQLDERDRIRGLSLDDVQELVEELETTLRLANVATGRHPQHARLNKVRRALLMMRCLRARLALYEDPTWTDYELASNA